MKHPKKRWLVPLLSVAVCAAVSLLAAWSDLTYNGGRLVYPMESYSFQRSDIPMLLALALDAFCALALLTFVLRQSILRRRREAETNRTRQLNPKLGFLGFFGFCGFLGFLPVSALSSYTPFVFFVFFGFFGFFFEGKMSNTLKDERFQENVRRARLDAYGAGIQIIFLLVVANGLIDFPPELRASVLLVVLSLTMALVLFLQEYLLYRYDRQEVGDDGCV